MASKTVPRQDAENPSGLRAGETELRVARKALTAAMFELMEHHAAARTVLALLDKMEFHNIMASTDHFDLVMAVETVLARLRDEALAAHNTCEAVVNQLREANYV